MSVVVDSRPRKVGSVLRKNIVVEGEYEDKDIETDKTESGTQTRFGKGSKGICPTKIKHLSLVHIVLITLENLLFLDVQLCFTLIYIVT